MANARASYIAGLAFSPDGNFLAANTGAGSILMWSLDDSELQFAHYPLPESDTRFTLSNCQITFSPDGKIIAHGFYTKDDYDSYVQLFNVEDDGTLLKTFEIGNLSIYRPESVSFSPNGDLLAVGTPDETLIFDSSSWK